MEYLHNFIILFIKDNQVIEKDTESFDGILEKQ